MELSLEDKAELQELEELLLRPEVRYDPAQLKTLLAPDFVEFGSSGRIYDRASLLEALAAPTPERLSLYDFSARALATGLALVTYRSIRRTADGVERQALRSSIWRRTGDGWQLIFHQGTPAAGGGIR